MYYVSSLKLENPESREELAAAAENLTETSSDELKFYSMGREGPVDLDLTDVIKTAKLAKRDNFKLFVCDAGMDMPDM
jgi:hypothetical protein